MENVIGVNSGKVFGYAIQNELTDAEVDPVLELRNADRFFGGYREYLNEYNPELLPFMRENEQPTCVRYDTELGNAFILHWMREGYVDLVFPGAADKAERLGWPLEWLREMEYAEISAIMEDDLVALRINVPEQDLNQPFHRGMDVETGYEAVSVLMGITRFVANMAGLASVQ